MEESREVRGKMEKEEEHGEKNFWYYYSFTKLSEKSTTKGWSRILRRHA